MHETSPAEAAGSHPMPGTVLLLLSAAGFLFAAQSALGVTLPDTVYPTADLYSAFVPNDYINLFFGVPCLIVSLALALRNARLGFIGAGGCLLFILYNSAAYLFALKDPYSLTLSALVTALCIAALIPYAASLKRTWADVDPSVIRRPKVYGGVLTVMGLVFVGRALVNIFGGVSSADAGVTIADAALCSLWIASGVALLLKKPGGSRIAAAAVCLLHGSLLFIALMIFLLIQPALCGTIFAAQDAAVVAVMSLAMLVPCGLLLRRLCGGAKRA